jgi:glycosyltransferase involved in cell wall biosynthesis
VKAVVFAVPGDLATPTGGYAYDRRIIAELPGAGWQPSVLDLGEGFPRPAPTTRAEACARLSALPPGQPIVVDGLAFGVLPEISQQMQHSHKLVALVHHPLALEAGLSPQEAAAFRANERAALACARTVVATSQATARLLAADYSVAAEALSVVEPGTDRVVVPSRTETNTVNLLAVGAIVPRKGYDVLIAALARLTDLPWRLTIAGDRNRDPETTQRLEATIDRLDLTGRVQLTGAVSSSELSAIYAAADLFVLASRFEGYGMAYTEALAHGVPVVGTRAGAIPDTVPVSAGVLVPPDDVGALAVVLRRVVGCPRERQRLAEGARAAKFPSWSEQAARFARVLDRVT